MSFFVPDPVSLAQDLIRCPSVTPADEGAQQCLIDALTPLGFSCTILPFGEISNLFARLGSGAPHFCFCGHTDVVPVGDQTAWAMPPFSATIRDGLLYGRGAADMKSNIACFVAAVGRYLDAHGLPDGSISLLITGDEEGLAVDGTVKVLEWMRDHGQIPDHALVGEPSNPLKMGDEIKIGRRGSVTGRLSVTGKQGHVAYPALADNPLPRMITLLSALTAHCFDQGSEFFAATNLEVTTIDTGNMADNVIPAKVTAQFNVRFNDRWSAASIEEKIREILDSYHVAYDLSCRSTAESFMTTPGDFTDLVAESVARITGRKPSLSTAGGTSDARFVQAYCPVVEYGLVNKTIHQVDEHCALADIESLTTTYQDILERYFQPVG